MNAATTNFPSFLLLPPSFYCSGREYPFGQLGAALLPVSSPNFLPNPSLLGSGGVFATSSRFSIALSWQHHFTTADTETMCAFTRTWCLCTSDVKWCHYGDAMQNLEEVTPKHVQALQGTLAAAFLGSLLLAYSCCCKSISFKELNLK